MGILNFIGDNWQLMVGVVLVAVASIWALITFKKDGRLVALRDELLVYMKEVEQMSESGATKFALVLAWGVEKARELNVKISKEALGKVINGLVDFSKSVNAREKDKLPAESCEEVVEQGEQKIPSAMNSAMFSMFSGLNKKDENK